MNEESRHLTREELFEKVWQEPISRLAPTFGLSSVELTKVCNKYEIPRPPVGYWSKLAFGKEVERPVLPDLDDEALTEIVSFRQNFDRVERPIAPKKIEVVVKEEAKELHPFVRRLEKTLKTVKPDEHGIVRTPQQCFGVRVGKASLPRAFRILDAVFSAWELQGGQVQFEQSRFSIGPDGVFVSLLETLRQVATGSRNHYGDEEFRYEPTGQLTLEIQEHADGLRRTWKDGKSQVLEKVLGNFIAKLPVWIEDRKNRRLDHDRQERQKAKAAKRRSAREAYEKHEKERKTEIMMFVERWETAERIRRYLNAVETKIEAKIVSPPNPETFALWLEWAHWYADQICPITYSSVRENSIEKPENCRIEDLDLTKRTREELSKFPVETTDELFLLTKSQFSEFCDHKHWLVWRESNLVLEGLGYDVGGRGNGYF